MAANRQSVDAHARLMARVAAEQEDTLLTLQLCGGDEQLTDRLWRQLVDLLVEGMFLDLRKEFLDGRIDRATYVDELTSVAERCRSAGLLPLPARGL